MNRLYVLIFLLLFGTSAKAQMPMQAARPWLGVAIENGKVGVLVKDVLPETPAAKYGLKAGDEITAIGTTTVKKPEELIRTVQQQGVGNTVVVHYMRAGKAEKMDVTLVAKPDELALVKKQLVGKPVPEFDLELVSGKGPKSSKDLKGKVTIVEFWATWCGACRSTHPRLLQLAKEKPELGIVLISDEDAATQKGYQDMGAHGLTMLRDATAKTMAAFHVAAIPQIVVIDRKGLVRFATIGAGEYLSEAIKEADAALAEKP